MKSILLLCLLTPWAFGQSSVESTENELIPTINKHDFANLKPFTGMKIRAIWDYNQLYVFEKAKWVRVFSDKKINEQLEKSNRKQAISDSWKQFNNESNPNFMVEKNGSVSVDNEIKKEEPSTTSNRYIMDNISKDLQIKLSKNEKLVYLKVYSLSSDNQLFVNNTMLAKKLESNSIIFYPYSEFSNEDYS
jgi:hypothetical protein